MPAFGNVVINDGQATPVAKTFKPVDIDVNNVSHYAETSGGIPLGYGRIGVSLRTPSGRAASGTSSKDRNYKILFKLQVPTLEVTSPSTGSGIQPAPTVAYQTVANLEFTVPERSTLAERKDILAYAKNLLSNALATSVVVDLENVY